MDVLSIILPGDFVFANLQWNWRDILYGLEAGLIDARVAVDAATERLRQEESSSPVVIDLAGHPSDDDVLAAVRSLASREADDGLASQKWLYLVLRWIFENKGLFKDPLQIVELAYADFDYPESVAPFVRYMPSEEPDLGSRALNESRLYEKWQAFLDVEQKRWAPIAHGSGA